MVIKIINCTFKEAWYSECIGFEFDVYVDENDLNYYFSMPFLAIYIKDAILIKGGTVE